jgi:hypothetical protein
MSVSGASKMQATYSTNQVLDAKQCEASSHDHKGGAFSVLLGPVQPLSPVLPTFAAFLCSPKLIAKSAPKPHFFSSLLDAS